MLSTSKIDLFNSIFREKESFDPVSKLPQDRRAQILEKLCVLILNFNLISLKNKNKYHYVKAYRLQTFDR